MNGGILAVPDLIDVLKLINGRLIYGFIFYLLGRNDIEASIKLNGFNTVKRNVARFSAIEPTTPEPIQIFAGCVFHGTEEIGGFGMLESPALCVGLKGIVEQLTPHNGFPEDV